ncbi:MAG: TIGR00282 family metallophosphoesterase [Alphaproteobacteria bacterium]
MTFRILFLGDIFAKPGRDVLAAHLPRLREKFGVTAVIANGENSAGGFGIHRTSMNDIFPLGVDIITLGDHTFDQKDAEEILTQEVRLVRPVNYPAGTVGKGFHVYEIAGKKIGVLNIMGRVFMRDSLDCPFQYVRKHQKENLLGVQYDALIVDMHKEATSEMAAMGHIWDGQASLVVGTHTHIPTADTRILPKGTGFQTDAGMCGIYESSIGMDFSGVMKRFERGGKFPMQPAGGEPTLCGVLVEIEENGERKGLCNGIWPIRVGGTLSQSE